MSEAVISELESESIEIIREVAATAARPVMLYSIGKDSSVMLRLAEKAFYPGLIPFPLMHIDTGWKLREMIAFRDRRAQELGVQLITYMNPRGVTEGIGPITHGSEYHTDVLKTEALKQALDLHGFDVAFGGARRDEEKSRAKERIFSFRAPVIAGSRRRSVPSFGIFTTVGSTQGRPFGLFRFPTGQRPTSGGTSAKKKFQLCRWFCRAASSRQTFRPVDHGGRRPVAIGVRRITGDP
jgi:phosphoadenosine phosphosulfate reductase family protein